MRPLKRQEFLHQPWQAEPGTTSNPRGPHVALLAAVLVVGGALEAAVEVVEGGVALAVGDGLVVVGVSLFAVPLGVDVVVEDGGGGELFVGGF